MTITRQLVVNGEPCTVTVADDAEPLLYVLRNRVGQHGPKFGCGVSQCGACSVIIDGEVRRSCVTPLRTVGDGAAVRTLDGLASPDGTPHPLQAAFVEEQAAQCGYCMNGMIIGALGWLEKRRDGGVRSVPTREEIADYLSGATPASTFNYICRCGAHVRIIEAIRRAAKEMAK